MPQNGSRSGRRRALKAGTRDRPFVLSARAFPGGVLRVIDDGPPSPLPSLPLPLVVPPTPTPQRLGGGRWPPESVAPTPESRGAPSGSPPRRAFPQPGSALRLSQHRGRGGWEEDGKKKKKEKREKNKRRNPSVPAARPHRPAPPAPPPLLGPSPQPPRPDPSLPEPAARSGATRPPSSPSLLPLSCRKRPFPLCLRRDAAKPSGAGPGLRRRQPPSRRKAAGLGGGRAAGPPPPLRPARSPPGSPPNHLW